MFKIEPGKLLVIAVVCAFIVLLPIWLRGCSGLARFNKAVQNGSIEAVSGQLRRNPGLVNRRESKQLMTPLHYAVVSDQAQMLEFLLEHGADVNARDKYGLTPLHKAAALGRPAIVAILLAAGADMAIYGTKYGVIGMYPLHLAAESGFADITELLLAKGADVNARTDGENSVTALHMAAGKNRLDVVKLLLAKGADVNAEDVRKNTPLRWALTGGFDEVADVLRQYGGLN